MSYVSYTNIPSLYCIAPPPLLPPPLYYNLIASTEYQFLCRGCANRYLLGSFENRPHTSTVLNLYSFGVIANSSKGERGMTLLLRSVTENLFHYNIFSSFKHVKVKFAELFIGFFKQEVMTYTRDSVPTSFVFCYQEIGQNCGPLLARTMIQDDSLIGINKCTGVYST